MRVRLATRLPDNIAILQFFIVCFHLRPYKHDLRFQKILRSEYEICKRQCKGKIRCPLMTDILESLHVSSVFYQNYPLAIKDQTAST